MIYSTRGVALWSSGTFRAAVTSDVAKKSTGTQFTTTIPAPATENPVPNMLRHNVKLVGNSQGTSGSFWLGLLINLAPVVIIIAAIFWHLAAGLADLLLASLPLRAGMTIPRAL